MLYKLVKYFSITPCRRIGALDVTEEVVEMSILFIFTASICTVVIAGRMAGRTDFMRADIALGIIEGMLAMGLERLLVSENLAASNMGLPLVAAIIVALGLASQRRGAAR